MHQVPIKTILNGNKLQKISFENPGDSRFNILEIKNNEGQHVEILCELVANILITNGLELSPIDYEEESSIIINNTNWKLTGNEVVNGNLYIKGSVVDLNGYSLTVRGNLIQSRGTVKINGGQLIVEGDYRLQSENVSGDGTVTYSASSGKLEMIDEEDYVLVNGDFAIQSSYKHTDYLKAGILEVKGDFTQKRNSGYSGSANNFNANTSHKVVLSGSKLQKISFENPGASRFNILEIENNTGQQVEFTNDLAVNTLITNGLELPPVTVNPTNWTLTGNEVVNGNLYIKGSVVDLNGYSLTVRGNLIQSRGTVKINGGQLIVEGDYRLQSENVSGDGTVTYSASSGKLEMIDEEDYVLVNGDFAIQSSCKHTDYLKAGILEVKGDFTQKRNSAYSGSAYNFNANTSHKSSTKRKRNTKHKLPKPRIIQIQPPYNNKTA